jgi:hypothetical protein
MMQAVTFFGDEWVGFLALLKWVCPDTIHT